MIVRDLEAAMKRHWETCKIGPWDIYQFEPGKVENYTYRGKPATHACLIAIAWSGDTQLELIQPLTGYSIYADGKSQVVGGTSAVAPLWAALISRLAQATGTRFGLIQPALYAGVSPGADAPGFHDITSGNNGAYSAGPGWDACTGLGSPDGTALVDRLNA